MSELGTIRERVERAVAYLEHQEAVVLTTFNLTGKFLEEQALPIILGVEAQASAAKRAETHNRLGETPVTVFYDPATKPDLSGHYRFVARPVPLTRGRRFHPKLIVIAGQSKNATTWVYLAVSSANLTLSGWGRNAECFGETWIHTSKQESHGDLDRLLEWLQGYAPLGEATQASDALVRVRAALARMPNRRRFSDVDDAPWSGTLYGRLYSSVVDREGLAQFVRREYGQRPSELWAYSPFWSDVPARVEAFNARRTVLIPAWKPDRSSLGLSREQRGELPGEVEVYRNVDDRERYWHLKVYCLYYRSKHCTVVGSCNFTRAGLVGAEGNVEAALVLEDGGEWLPWGECVCDEHLAPELVAEEDDPAPLPVAINVAYDWGSSCWRWWLESAPGQRDFVLKLPEDGEVPTDEGTHEQSAQRPPSRGARFSLRYRDEVGWHCWTGLITEINLDGSTRVYGRPLTASDILDSWRGRPPPSEPEGNGDNGNGGEGNGNGDGHQAEAAAFDAVNLYEFYRAIRDLRERLGDPNSSTDRQGRRALIVGRPDSVQALANLANQDGEAPVVRYLVLCELRAVVQDWASLLEDDEYLKRVGGMAEAARLRTRDLVASEITKGSRSDANEMLEWFDSRLSQLNAGAS